LKAGWDSESVKDALSLPEVPKPLNNQTTAPPNPVTQNPLQDTTHQTDTQKNNQKKFNGLSIVALILAVTFPPLGLICGIIALSEIKKKNQEGKTIAILAIVLSALLMLLLIVLLLLGLVLSFGILDPSLMLPDRCQFTSGMDCMDKASITSSTTTITMRNNLGINIEIKGVDSNCAGITEFALDSSNEYHQLKNDTVESNQIFKLRMNGCNNGKSGSKFNERITINYNGVGSQLPRTVIGDIRGRVV
jgi:hypothetical protein